MSLTMLTVGGVQYVSYATLAEANAYLRVTPAPALPPQFP